MTAPTLTPAPADTPRPGSRAARLRQPLARDVLKGLAESAGVCVRPLAIRRTDRWTGETEIIEVPCGARLANKCKPCAERNRRLRIQQLREGWHLGEEPTVQPDRSGDEVLALVRLRCHFEFERDAAMRESRWDQVADLDDAIDELDQVLAEQPIRGNLTPRERDERPRRKRSTRRRRDAVDLPRLLVEKRTVGRAYAGRGGKTHRPSMLLTVTLPSYGPVHSDRRRGAWRQPCECGQLHGQTDPLLGTPIDPNAYDYRRAALDAIHFAKVLDRLWQNIRRAAGWNVQYGGAIELQKRLAPHAHYAMRGTLPRRLLHQVAAATYHQVWWPQFDAPMYTVAKPPVWDADAEAYVDPTTRQPLTTWAQALDEIDDPEATPAYVVRVGRIDPRGIEGGTKDADRAVRYVTKYLTKDLTEHAAPKSEAQRAHFDRLHAELATLPCAPTCANWLLYGVQPDKAKPGLTPGRCSGKVHQRSTLGFTGRRVLISRQWSGKTLADHRADNRAWVRAILAGNLADDDQAHDDQDQGDGLGGDPTKRYAFELAKPDDPDVPPLEYRIMRAISARDQWKRARQQALTQPPIPVSATPLGLAA